MTTQTDAPIGTADVEDNVHWLRSDTLEVILAALFALSWLAIVPYLRRPADFLPGWGEPLLLIGALVVAFNLRRRSYELASAVTIGSLATIVTLHVAYAPAGDQLAPLLYIPAVLVAGTLRGATATLLVAALATAALVIRPFLLAAAPVDLPDLVQSLLVVWLTTLTSWLTTRNLYTTLSWLWESQRDAQRHLDEALRHQGNLSATLKQLADATYRLERMNYAINWARLEAEEARRLKAQFAAHVSHELRTPINLIAGFSEIMLNNPKAYGGVPLPAQYQSDLETLHRSARHLQGLIDDILDLSQLDAKAMPVLRQMVDVRTVVNEAVETVRQFFERKHLSLEVAIAPDVGTAYLDPLRIRQVLLNLLSNASRFTSVGGVQVRAWTERGQLVLSVADTGAGIAPDEIPHLFEPFHRVGSSGMGGHDGWGLGLAICKQFVDLHGGTIAVASEGVPGRGAVFTIRLPLRAQPAPTAPALPPQRAISRLRVTTSPPIVAVLETDPHVVNLYRRYLSAFQIAPVATVSEAIDLVRSVGAHALVVDLTESPNQTAWDQDWASLCARHGIRVICCPMPSGRQLAQTRGLVDFLVKPVTRDVLLTTVERANPRAKTIAVIDDDPAMVRLLSRMLQASEKHYRIVRAFDGQEGLDLVRRVRPDLVLLDLIMPQVGGLSLLEILRNDPVLADVPVVAVSAKGVAEVFPPPDGRQLTLVMDRGLTVAETLRAVRAMLESLPPTTTGGTGTGGAPPAAPRAAAAFG